MRVTRVPVKVRAVRLPCSSGCTRGCAQCSTRALMPGAATKWGSVGGGALASTWPNASSTRTVLALQGRTTSCAGSRAVAKRLSRTVKYCVPWSKPPNSVRRVAMRPPRLWLFSNSVTRCPACSRVRAQATPAMPAPTTAMWRGALGTGAAAEAFAALLRAGAAAAGAVALERLVLLLFMARVRWVDGMPDFISPAAADSPVWIK